MHDNEILEIVQASAKAKAQQHSYYEEPFFPHAWVVDAMREVERRTLERAAEVCHAIGRDGHISMLPGAPRCAHAIRALMEGK